MGKTSSKVKDRYSFIMGSSLYDLIYWYNNLQCLALVFAEC